MKSWYDIPGWFDFQDVYSMAVDEGASVIVELGCWLGRSTRYLMDALSMYWVQGGEPGDYVVYCVDTWEGSGEDQHIEYMKDHDIYAEFCENFESEIRRGELVVIKGDSAAAAERFKDGECDFVFVDASHEYMNVKNDILSWWPKIARGGMMAGHDVNWPGVEKAVLECFGPVEIRGISWIARKA
jgi:SAM-dependent methyltransferase